MNTSESPKSQVHDTVRGLALITGASSGIGRAFARRLATDGYDLIAVGRRRDRLDELAAEFPNNEVTPLVADLGTNEGIDAVAKAISASASLTMLINNAGVAHYMSFVDLPPDKASELLHVKAVAPAMLARAAVPAMVTKGRGTIINVSGMLAFGASAQLGPAAGRATYVATLAHMVAFSQALDEELKSKGIRIQVLCPGIVATEFHERQGMDLSALPRMSAEDVVTGSLRGLALGELVCAPGVERADLLEAVVSANLAAFAAQSPQLADRYR
ncbi:short-chain dehydrogenase [Sphingobium sp. SCG-1]|uniref:SDR family NAD(P)-dependent oxidoreductase n=1 Tax=Sphingobium sp. SCG-1 TaxID=2072936 RepID=UPI000CD6A55C|nr:SDR family NAD(P)-dependent oxidoreductase [Sphingobium sp. SCG-1]AUW57171.1 short-chain dehydrogenase [Sphingobium sp. SCG-1]